ncbi:AraC family transcriptional regulator [Cohnella hashimotonis]|uniref:AraC family transcriptional regulator n=1 Tax=Cohnella hashimotonis TaxID=2826895 RepID=A0ABT6TLW0_9BACL|nr:AraC family transcriptional regulator [Cohnella hashimotonis]MDI4647833.1 AraC family transcriptional regulator [Cohnella hashimotonis]
MRLRNRLGQQPLFLRMMLPYFLFMLLALTLGWLFYNKTYHVVKEEVVRNNMQILEQVKNTLDSRFSEINTISLQLLNDPGVNSFQRVSDPFSSTNTYKVLRTQKSLYSYNASNNFVLDYFLIFKNSNLALSSNSSYELPYFYDHVLTYNEIGYKAWRDDLLSTYRNREIMPTGAARYEDKTYDMITYVQSLGYPGRIQGALIVLVDGNELKSLLSGIDISDGGSASIIDDKGRVVASLSGDGSAPALGGSVVLPGLAGTIEASDKTDGRMVTYTTSSYNKWSYVVAQPPHIVLGKVISIKKLTFSIVAVFLGLGIVLAYLFATRSGRPLVRIMSTLRDRHQAAGAPRKPKDMYGYIQQSLSSLLDNNAELREEIDKQVPLVWDTFFQRLLKGDFLSMNEINSLLAHQRIGLHGQGYAIGILNFSRSGQSNTEAELDKLDVNRVWVTEAIRRGLGDDRYAHHIAEDKIALLFVDELGDEASFRHMIDRSVAAIEAETSGREGLQLYFAIGGFRSTLLEVSGSYEEARQCLSSISYEGKNETVWFADLPHTNARFFFPQELENRLINYAKAGEPEEVEAVLRQLYKENFSDRHLPLALQQLFYYEIVSCLAKLQEQLALDNAIDIQQLLQHPSAVDNPKLSYRSASEMFLTTARDLDRRKKSRNHRLLDDMLAFLQQHYGDANLTLDAVADNMNVSKGYMSQFFKEQTGINFSEYLENMRMDEAKSKLASTSLTIREIAEQVGYHSSSTFCRAFKRGTGLSATVFRELARNETTYSSATGHAGAMSEA